MSTRQPGDFALHQDNRTRGLTEVDKRVPWIADDSDSLIVKQEDGTVLEFFPGAHQPSDSDLTAIATLATTAFGRALLTLVDAAQLASAAGLGKLSFPAWMSIAVDGDGTQNRRQAFRSNGVDRYAVIIGNDNAPTPIISHTLYDPAGAPIDSWAQIARNAGQPIYLGGNGRPIVISAALKQGAGEVERISANGEFSGKFNVFGGNEVILANGYNNALGQLYINYRGGTLPILNYKICDGMGAGSTANLTAKSFVKDGGLPTQLLLADGTTKLVSDFAVANPIQILDGSLTFATNYPTALLFGAAANFPVNFWSVGKVVEAEGVVLSVVAANVSVHFFGGNAEQYIQAINLSPSAGSCSKYRSVLKCTAVASGLATIQHTFSYSQTGTAANGASSTALSAIPVAQVSSFYLKASGAIGTVDHVGAIAKTLS